MLTGIIIIILGIILLINELNLGFRVDFDLIWPMLFILSSIYFIIRDKKISFFPVVLFILGASSLLNELGVHIGRYIWPIIVIALGLCIILNKLKFKNIEKDYEINKNGVIEFNGVFGGVKEKVKHSNFPGASINAVFGGVELNLTEIKIKNDIKIEVNSVFGGTTIYLPDDYNVVVSDLAFFGGNDNKKVRNFDEKKKTIYINCVSIFGGTELK